MRDTEFDWFNNPYISPNVYEFDQDWLPRISDKVKLKLCDKNRLTKVLGIKNVPWYKNAICFEDVSKIKLDKNWYEETYNGIRI